MLRISCKVSDEPLNPAREFETTHEHGHGAINCFFGSVRESNHGKKVVAVAYDAFIPLAEKILNEICVEACHAWGEDLCISVVHRTGKLLVGELSVGIVVSSRHRNESYLASRYIIEQIKLRAPIWKKEFYENGETEWLKGHALCQHTAPEAVIHECGTHA
jgi:molybdopterin synthase catalytic subunit